MYLISVGASDFEPIVLNICKLKNTPPFVCSHEIVSSQCPSKTDKNVQLIKHTRWQSIKRELLSLLQTLYSVGHGCKSDVPHFFLPHASPIELLATKRDSNLYRST